MPVTVVNPPGRTPIAQHIAQTSVSATDAEDGSVGLSVAILWQIADKTDTQGN